MSDFDNNEEERGFETELHPRDVIVTVWKCIWIIPITILMVILIQEKINDNKINKMNKDFKAKAVWILGFTSCLFIYIRDWGGVMAFITWLCTYEYHSLSPSYLSDIVLFICWMFGGAFLYLFFIYRLYIVYNAQNQPIVAVNGYWYILLLTLNFIYFCSMFIICIGWIIFNRKLYVIGHSLCLVLEVIMYCIILILFSKPMLDLQTASNKDKNTQVDCILMLLTRLNILSSVALLTTIIKRIFDIISMSYCPDECNLTSINYSLLDVDSFFNIFCILCSFNYGTKYYNKYCMRLHRFV
eukprot:473793_1